MSNTKLRIRTDILAQRFKPIIPDFDKLDNYLNQGSDKIIKRFFREKPHGQLTPEEVIAREKRIQEVKSILEMAPAVLNKIRLNQPLTPGEKWVECCIIVNIGRPALLLSDGRFAETRSDLGPLEVIDDHRDEIQINCKSVGRIEPSKSSRVDPNVPKGTGFLVAKDVIITNRHVLSSFASPISMTKWVISEPKEQYIDYCEEKDADQTRKEQVEFKIKRVIGVHPLLDVALLRIEKKSLDGEKSELDPLIIDSNLPQLDDKRPVYVIGYPYVAESDNPIDVEMVFDEDLGEGYKRLAPGLITGGNLEESLLFHDCSTLGGNSGSCLVDVKNNTIIGLHAWGRLASGRNEAIALSSLKDHTLFKKAKVEFSG